MSAPASVPNGNAAKSTKGVSRSLPVLRKILMPIPVPAISKTSIPSKSSIPTLSTTAELNISPRAAESQLQPIPVSTTEIASQAKPAVKKQAKDPQQAAPSAPHPTTTTSTALENKTSWQHDLPLEVQQTPSISPCSLSGLQPWGLQPTDVIEEVSLAQADLSPIPSPPADLSLTASPQPLLYYQFNTTNRRLQMLPAVIHTIPGTHKERSNRGGCLVWTLVLLVILLIGLSMSWFFAIRPLLHTIAQTKLDTALKRTEEGIHPPLLFLSGIMVPIQEHTITELLVSNLTQADPIKNPVTHITPSNVRLDFQIYSFPSAISVIPQVDNGHLVVRNVHIEGIIGLILSPDEIATLLDTHLAHAEEHFQHSVTDVQLQDHEMDLTF